MVVDPLIVDVYAKSPVVDIAKLVAAGPPWHGISMKATEGTYYPRQSEKEWFLKHWLPARILAGARYGIDFFRQAYHYHRVDQDPLLQANKLLQLLAEAGGEGPGDLQLMIDVESAENPPNASAQQIIDSVSTFAARIRAVTGRSIMLYGNIYLAERGVKATMGCGLLEVAHYAADLPSTIYQRIGWRLQNPAAMPTPWGWQYCGDPDGGLLKGYPTSSPMGPGPADITAVIVAGGGKAAIDWTRNNIHK
jgi:GH25 family lysozyme M1 (1,4-beta-N-acetylmuramidase)